MTTKPANDYKTRSIVVQHRLTPKVFAKAKVLAAKDNRPLSNWISHIITTKVNRRTN
jgi:predicted HicB family RNase H-like nuclease